MADHIDKAIHEWAAEQLGIGAYRIRSVEFGTIRSGYCETCEYTTFGATVVLTSGRTETIEEYDATQVIRDINAKVVKP